MNYTQINSDEELFKAIEVLNSKEKIAVDFEGEFNLHVYGEHLCLIQVYDGDVFYIIDPRSKALTVKGLEAFFSMPVKKVWFDCQSDHSLVYKNYELKIANIMDIRVMAKALGYDGNLLGLVKEYLGIELTINKKKNQQANWMRRPIDEELIKYALMDVTYLFQLEDILSEEVSKKNLSPQVDRLMKKATDVKKPEPGYKRIGNWRHYTESEKNIVRHLYLSRDALARRFNVPAARVMDKKRIIEFAKNPPKTIDMMKVRLSAESPRFRELLAPKVWEALEKARKENMENIAKKGSLS